MKLFTKDNLGTSFNSVVCYRSVCANGLMKLSLLIKFKLNSKTFSVIRNIIPISSALGNLETLIPFRFRFGRIPALKTIKSVKKGEELFSHYKVSWPSITVFFYYPVGYLSTLHPYRI
jgi:hypothetical protein